MKFIVRRKEKWKRDSQQSKEEEHCHGCSVWIAWIAEEKKWGRRRLKMNNYNKPNIIPQVVYGEGSVYADFTPYLMSCEGRGYFR